jgi:hypothetical protein
VHFSQFHLPSHLPLYQLYLQHGLLVVEMNLIVLCNICPYWDNFGGCPAICKGLCERFWLHVAFEFRLLVMAMLVGRRRDLLLQELVEVESSRFLGLSPKST